MESKWLIQKEGDEIIYRMYSWINLTRYIEKFEERLKEDGEKFGIGEIDVIVNAMCLRIRNKNSQSTDFVGNGTT